MKKLLGVAVIGLLASGCVSTVTTYDASGKVLGMCEAKRGFVIGGGAHCGGTADNGQFQNMKSITLNRE